ncbi:hypothetical protein Pelo_15412 [Pelomyxa schiedti]|nr:hypothetical protein Pelo_15412 [Pelomyxa schiedti]
MHSATSQTVPVVTTKSSKTITSCFRSYNAIAAIRQSLSQSPSTPDATTTTTTTTRSRPTLLQLGVGLATSTPSSPSAPAVKFVPEFVELVCAAWDTPCDLDVVDHSPEAIALCAAPRLAYCPPSDDEMAKQVEPTKKRTLLDQVRLRSVPVKPADCGSGSCSSSEGSGSGSGSGEVLLEVDMGAAFEMAPERYDVVVALNSVWYLLRNPEFRPHHPAFVKRLLLCLKIEGCLYLDQPTFGMIEALIEAIHGFSVNRLGGYPISIFMIQRTQ